MMPMICTLLLWRKNNEKKKVMFFWMTLHAVSIHVLVDAVIIN